MLRAIVVCVLALAIVVDSQSVVSSFVNQWQTVPTSNTPGARSQGVFVATDDIAMSFGGIHDTDLNNDNAVLDLVSSAWTTVVAARPSRRSLAAAAVATGTDFAYLYGGCTSVTAGTTTCTAGGADMWRFSFNARTWLQLLDGPSARYGAVGAYYLSRAGKSQFIVVGGVDATFYGMYIYNIDDATFHSVVTGAIGPKQNLIGHSAVVVGSTLYVWGGQVAGVANNDFWAFDLEAESWTQLSSTGSPSARYGQATVATLGGMFIVGGTLASGTVTGETYFVNLTGTPSWSQLIAGSVNTGSGAVMDAGNPLVFSGRNGADTNSVQRYYVRPRVSNVSPASGGNCGGDTITVTGDHIVTSPSPVCVFGTTIVAGTRVSDTVMTCVSPVADVGAVNLGIGLSSVLTSSPSTASVFTYVEDVTSPTTSGITQVPLDASAGRAGTFKVQARTSCGTLRTSGGDVVTANIQMTSPLMCNVTDNSDGTYTVSYYTEVSGTYTIHVTIGGVAVATASMGVVPGVISLADTNAVLPSGTISAGSTATIAVSSKDIFGNTISDLRRFSSVAVLSNTLSVFGSITGGGGSINVAFPLTAAGVYQVTITADNTRLLVGSPYALTISPGAIDAASSTASGFGTQFAVVGLESKVIVQPRDVYGNPLNPDQAVGLGFQVGIYGSNDQAAVPGTVTSNADGTYTVAYTGTRIGQYSVFITLDGVNVRGSPFAITMRLGDSQDVTNSLAFGDGLSGGVAGREYGFTIQTRDRFGNNVTRGGQKFTVALDAATDIVVNDYDDGQYLVTYSLKHLGHFGDNVMTVTNADGAALAGSPFTVHVTYGVVFFVVVFLAVVAFAIILGVGGTYALHRLQRYCRHRKLMRDPEVIFPAHDPDADVPEDYAMQSDFLVPNDTNNAGVRTLAMDVMTPEEQKEMDTNWDTPPAANQNLNAYLANSKQNIGQI